MGADHIDAFSATVVIETYKRAWALPFCLEGLVNQTRLPDEIIVVVKRSSDESEKILEDYRKLLPLKLVFQKSGNVVNAVELALSKASGDIVLFLDDDAIPDVDWVRRYESLFSSIPDSGGFCGITYSAFLSYKCLSKSNYQRIEPPTRGPHRKPMKIFRDYSAWLSLSGYAGISNSIYDSEFQPVKSADPGGANMAWLRKAISNLPLSELFINSKRGFMYEHILSYAAKRNGYDSYVIRNPLMAPIVWHISHVDSLSRGEAYTDLYWKHFDKAAMFWRLRSLGAEVSLWRYFLALSLTTRSLPRALGSIRGLLSSLQIANIWTKSGIHRAEYESKMSQTAQVKFDF